MKLMPRGLHATMMGALVLSIVSVTAPIALAQDEPASATEVQLRREIATLRDRLASAEERIRSLESERDEVLKQLAQARAAAASGSSGGAGTVPDAGPQEPRAPVPEDPFASPASMLVELRARYEAEFSSLPHDTDPAIEDYQEDVRVWCRAGVRDLRDRRQWLVTVSDVKARDNDRRRFDATIRVIDEASGLPIGEPLKTTIDTSTARKIEAGKDRFAYWRATVIVSASPTFNQIRPDAGVFEHPPFVGRYCDFGVQLDWRMFQGVRAEVIEKNKAPAPPKSPSRR